jgi:hypothetical protein
VFSAAFVSVHTFAAPGTYTAVFSASDTGGEAVSVVKSVEVH